MRTGREKTRTKLLENFREFFEVQKLRKSMFFSSKLRKKTLANRCCVNFFVQIKKQTHFDSIACENWGILKGHFFWRIQRSVHWVDGLPTFLRNAWVASRWVAPSVWRWPLSLERPLWHHGLVFQRIPNQSILGVSTFWAAGLSRPVFWFVISNESSTESPTLKHWLN